MDTTKHTPGPWTFEMDESGVYHIKSPSHPGSLFCDEQYYPWCSDNPADWHLIAAAPELLAALKALAAHMDRAGGDPHGMPECPWCKAGPHGDDHMADCELLAAREALAKAEPPR